MKTRTIQALLWVVVYCCVMGATPSTPPKTQDSGIPARIELLTNTHYFKRMIEHIDAAQSELVFSYYVFKTGKRKDRPKKLLNALLRAHERGVKVSGVLEFSSYRKDKTSAYNMKTLRVLQGAGIEARRDSGAKRNHSKLLVVDKRYTFIGSHNLTHSALSRNHEASVLIDSPQLAAETLDFIRTVD